MSCFPPIGVNHLPPNGVNSGGLAARWQGRQASVRAAAGAVAPRADFSSTYAAFDEFDVVFI